MTAEILTFPDKPAGQPVAVAHRSAVGDIVVACVNATYEMWCAWPVALVDDDGVVLAVRTQAGKVIGVDRLSCADTVLGLAARDHEPTAFASLRWRTWAGLDFALQAFARAAVKR